MRLSIAPSNDLSCSDCFERLLPCNGFPDKGPTLSRMCARLQARMWEEIRGQVQAVQSSLTASLKPCHAPVTTAPLCLFELSLPIRGNK